MTALDIVRLHREALPQGCPDILRLMAPRPSACRPVLSATWQVEADGRLFCRWDTDDPVATR